MIETKEIYIDRREAIQKVTTLMGGTLTASLIGGTLAGCKAEKSLDWKPLALTPVEIKITITLAEQILPATSTAGAREARVERFIDSMVHGYLSGEERARFIEGLAHLHQRRFIKKTLAEQYQIVHALSDEARSQVQKSKDKPFFLLAKELILLGFFTSKVGATQVLNYDPIPGRYDGCLSLEEAGGKTWAT